MTRYEAIEAALEACLREMKTVADTLPMYQEYHGCIDQAKAALALPEDSKTEIAPGDVWTADGDKLRAELDNRALEEQLAHCDGNDCKCCAYGQCECACDADWTPAEVYRLRAQLRDALRELAAYKQALTHE